MGFSSLRNAIKRKTHKERSQPAARKKYGLLEKHKDYVERARDFHKKERTIKALKRKAEQRNPDEFYFAMEKSRTKGGVHDGSLSKPNKYTQEELALMKTQDVKYLSTRAQAEAHKVEALKSQLHFIGAPQQSKHTIFVDEAKEAKAFKPEEYFDTPKELLGRTFNRPRTAMLQDESAVALAKGKDARKMMNKAEKRKAAAYQELSQRLERQTKLARTASKLAYEKEVAGKGRKRKLSKKELAPSEDGKQSRVFKWKRERKK